MSVAQEEGRLGRGCQLPDWEEGVAVPPVWSLGGTAEAGEGTTGYMAVAVEVQEEDLEQEWRADLCLEEESEGRLSSRAGEDSLSLVTDVLLSNGSGKDSIN